MATEPSDTPLSDSTGRDQQERVSRALHDARRDLIDITRRNRLLHSPRTGKRIHCLDIFGVDPNDLFNGLVRGERAYGFRAEDLDTSHQVEDAGPRTLQRLGTRLDAEKLERRLLKFFREARVYEEEQGVNILYVVIGFLKWYEDARSEEACWAPLILVPVSLERRQGRDLFVLRGRDEDLVVNVSLREKLKSIGGIELPDLPDNEDWTPTTYLEAVRAAIAGERRWEVIANDVGLGFFTFSKYLMWRDLDAASWPNTSSLLAHPLVSALLGEGVGFGAAPPPLAEDNEPIDGKVDLASAIHVMDADSSQALVIEEARKGGNLVVQGPPGTGKSQTIANIIAAAVHDGRSVLFVAEKAAALDVVHARLKKVGLDPLCLELHSRKANKVAVVSSLDKALKTGGSVHLDGRNSEELRKVRDHLNSCTAALHRPIRSSGMTPYGVMGKVLRLRVLGTLVPDIELNSASSWSAEKIREVEGAVERAAAAARKLNCPPNSHPWKAATGGRLTPFDFDRLRPVLSKACDAAGALSERQYEALRRLGHAETWSIDGTPKIVRALRLLASAPAHGRECLSHPSWRADIVRIAALNRNGRHWSLQRGTLVKQVIDRTWAFDLHPIRRAIAAHGRSLFRLFIKGYRTAVSDFRGLCRSELPKDHRLRLELLDDLIAAQEARNQLKEASTFAAEVLGTLWAVEETQWEAVDQLVAWSEEAIKTAPDFELLGVASRRTISDPSKLADEIEQHSKALDEMLGRIASIAKVEPTLVGHPRWSAATCEELTRIVNAWRDHVDVYNDWVGVRDALKTVRDLGVQLIADDLSNGTIQPDQARPLTDLLIAEAIWKAARSDSPEVEEIEGTRRTGFVESFRSLDRKRIQFARAEVLARYLDRRPDGDAGEMGIIRAEIGKKRRHLPIRKLMEKAGTAVQRVKPVFLMSPLSVAQFLPPGKTTFDLLVVDEASQVTPQDALGAIARARAVIVVGDDKQLPPTNFFRMVLDDGEETQPEEGAPPGRTRDFESILTLGRVRGIPERMLRWHYRSRHPSLIALSNARCYGGSLLLPPSPLTSTVGIGLSLQKTPAGHYERGGSGRNNEEADIVAAAIEHHMQEHPGVSLGVACFSVAQRDAIDDALAARSLMSAVEAFVPKGERLFVKNLETVQGDERDVIFISVGYGKDASGRMTQNYGPVSLDGGERRLNVLITRARQRCVVFSSIGAGDIPSDSKPLGTRMLREFLFFAETGQLAAGEPTTNDFDSPFEEAVAIAIRKQGYEVVPQIGVSGFRIDLGILAPGEPGRFVLGIECDGAAYHSGRSARDRDRLRQEVLENLGWRLHRIWSTDWFRNPDREQARLMAAIEQACSPVASPPNRPEADRSGDGHAQNGTETGVDVRSELEAPPATETRISPRMHYKECQLEVTTGQALLDLSPIELSTIAVHVVSAECPIHTEEVARRVREAFGLGRTGQRILSAIRGALREAAKRGQVEARGEFWTVPGRVLSSPRDRRHSAPPLRKASMIPPEEYYLAIFDALRSAVSLEIDELCVQTSRLLGFDRTGSELDAEVRRRIKELLGQRTVSEVDGRIRLVEMTHAEAMNQPSR